MSAARPDPFARRPLLLGVVHLPPLPGSPRFGGSREEVRAAARADAHALVAGGFDGFIVENFGDAPFHPRRVEPGVIAAMAVLVADLRVEVGEGAVIGVNVLRNDAGAALSVAAAAGADLIRVNVHTQGTLTDQGWIEGEAARTLRMRRTLAAEGVRIAADVGVKHAIRPPGFSVEESARETVGRGLADALIVSGAGTGRPTDPDEIARVRAVVPGTPILVGSGADAGTIAGLLECADGVIVGTSLKEDGDVGRPVDPDRVRAFAAAAREGSSGAD